MTDKLKLCPFCGKAPRSIPDKVPGMPPDSVMCTTDHCAMWNRLVTVEQWQTRVADRALEEIIKQGMEDVKAGRVIPQKEVFKRFAEKFGWKLDTPNKDHKEE